MLVTVILTGGLCGRCCHHKDTVSVKIKILTCEYLGHPRGGWCLVITGGTVGDGHCRRQ